MSKSKGYRIEATKGMAQCLGDCCVKFNGKIVRYFMTFDEANIWVQSQMAAFAQ